MKRLLCMIFIAWLLCGCQKQDAVTDSTNAEMFTDRDLRDTYEQSEAVFIQLQGDSAACSSDAVKIIDTTVMILDEGTFIFSGTLEDGMIIVDADENDKPQLVFNNVTVNSETSAALYIRKADKVCVTLAAGSSNELSNGGTFISMDDNSIDGAVFSKQDLTFNGSGSLTVTSPADHGMVCKDDLVITGGTYTVNCASHGLDANDSIRLIHCTLSIASGKDGIHAENSDDAESGFVYIENGTYTISAEGDGISAGSYMQIAEGTYNIITGGGSQNAKQHTSENWGGFMGGMGIPGGGMGGKGGMGGPGDDQNMIVSDDTSDTDASTSIKAVKATGPLTINGGTFTINSADDSIHSNTSVIINGGTFDIASGDDGFHADESLTIHSGSIAVTESYEGLEALDLLISGGDIDLIASDDGLNAAGGTDSSGTGGRDGGMPGGKGGMGASNGSITITGGTIAIQASGDGIDANGCIEISGGETTVCGPTMGDTATLDYDTTCSITGGTFIGTGASGMAQTFSTSSGQGVIAVQVGNQRAGTEILLKDSNGNPLLTHTPELDYAVAIISTPEIIKGKTYTLEIGDVTGDVPAN